MTHVDSSSQYTGDVDQEGRRHGYGCQRWDLQQKYCGTFVEDNLHGEGVYTNLEKDKYIYEGCLYANRFEGYGRIIQEDCTYFEGLHRGNQRFGPGVLTYPNGSQDVGLWLGPGLIRLSEAVHSEWIPKLACTNPAKIQLLGHRKLVSVQPHPYKANLIIPYSSNPDAIYNKNIRNPGASAFNKPAYDAMFFGDYGSYIEVAVTEEEMLGECEYVEPREVQEVIQLLLKQVDRFLDSSGDELKLLELKKCFLEILPKMDNPINVRTKKIPVKNLLAWNNGHLSIELLKHSFLHRNNESVVNFDVSKLLAGDRSAFGVAGFVESACVAFLKHCLDGKESEAKTLLQHFAINPDLADANGNSAIFFACCRDRWGSIRFLTNAGGNLDAINDENLTPLTMTLTRYIAFKRGVSNWEEAFLERPQASAKDLEEVSSWRPQSSLISLIAKEYAVKHNDGIFFNETKELLMFALQRLEKDNADFDEVFEKLGLIKVSESLRDFQKPYRCAEEDSPNAYVFHTDFRRKVKEQKAKKKVKTKVTLVAEEKLELDVIANTVRVLLYYGADPNFGELPLPPLFLAVYTENLQILSDVLQAGANANAVCRSMTALHFICNMPSSAVLPEMAQILLSNGAEPNYRTAPDHWLEEGSKIMGKEGGDVIEGKTALHMLAMRQDEIAPGLIEMLVEAAGKHLNYLGHTPLSLAVLRGNVEAVDRLLKAGTDPNQILGNNLGVALTIYILNRYSTMLPDIKVCAKITDLLVGSYANPLNPTGLDLNAVEFMLLEESNVPVTGDTRKGKRQKNKKAKKKKKKSSFEVCKEALMRLTRDVVLRHYQFQAHVENYKKLMFSEEVNGNLVKYLAVDEALKMHQLLIDRKVIDLREDLHAFLTYQLFELYAADGFKVKKKKKKKKPRIGEILEGLQLPGDEEPKVDAEKKPRGRRRARKRRQAIREFELDPDEEKYVVCFQCLMKKGKVLIVCPKCGLVHFCSEACNKANLRMKGTRHPCKGLFYADQLKRYEELKALGLSLPKLGGNALLGLRNELKAMGQFLRDNLLKNLLGDGEGFVNPFTADANQIGAGGKGGKGSKKGKGSGKGSSGRGSRGKSGKSSSGGRSSSYSESGGRSKSGRSSGRGSRSEGRGSRRGGRGSKSSGKGSESGRTRSESTGSGTSRSKSGKRSSRSSRESRDKRSKSGGGSKGRKTKGGRGSRGSDDESGGRRGRGKKGKSGKGSKFDNDVDARGGKKKKKGAERGRKITRTGAVSQNGDKFGKGDVGIGKTGASDEQAKKQSGERGGDKGANERETGEQGEGDRSKIPVTRLPTKYQTFMRKLAELFPDLDWSSLLLPFICFTDGQLYYRFSSRRPVFCPTYTGI